MKKKRIYRTKFNNATKKGHIHKHNPTWLPNTRVAKTHAWYRRQKLIPPTRIEQTFLKGKKNGQSSGDNKGK